MDSQVAIPWNAIRLFVLAPLSGGRGAHGSWSGKYNSTKTRREATSQIDWESRIVGLGDRDLAWLNRRNLFRYDGALWTTFGEGPGVKRHV